MVSFDLDGSTDMIPQDVDISQDCADVVLVEISVPVSCSLSRTALHTWSHRPVCFYIIMASMPDAVGTAGKPVEVV